MRRAVVGGARLPPPGVHRCSCAHTLLRARLHAASMTMSALLFSSSPGSPRSPSFRSSVRRMNWPLYTKGASIIDYAKSPAPVRKGWFDLGKRLVADLYGSTRGCGDFLVKPPVDNVRGCVRACVLRRIARVPSHPLKDPLSVQHFARGAAVRSLQPAFVAAPAVIGLVLAASGRLCVALVRRPMQALNIADAAIHATYSEKCAKRRRRLLPPSPASAPPLTLFPVGGCGGFGATNPAGSSRTSSPRLPEWAPRGGRSTCLWWSHPPTDFSTGPRRQSTSFSPTPRRGSAAGRPDVAHLCSNSRSALRRLFLLQPMLFVRCCRRRGRVMGDSGRGRKSTTRRAAPYAAAPRACAGHDLSATAVCARRQGQDEGAEAVRAAAVRKARGLARALPALRCARPRPRGCGRTLPHFVVLHVFARVLQSCGCANLCFFFLFCCMLSWSCSAGVRASSRSFRSSIGVPLRPFSVRRGRHVHVRALLQ